VPEQLDELVLWATEKSPDERPVDAHAMLERLREIERELGVFPQVARAAQTGVIREATPTSELTAVLPAAVTGATSVVSEVDNSTRLRRATKRRQGKGWWLIVLVLLLAALAGAAGWWFGSGPGSMVSVADVADQTFAQAKARLADDTLVAVQKTENNLTVAPGKVIGTDPAAGTPVDKDTKVTVLVSLGPAPVKIAKVIGTDQAEVRNTLKSQVITVDDQTRPFFTGWARDIVVGMMLAPSNGSAAIACGEGCNAHQGDKATLWVSLGALPSVANQSPDQARATLTTAGLKVAANVQRATSNSVPAGQVIGITSRVGGGWWRPGDPTTLVVSTGPALFKVPDVRGMTIADAVSTLQGAGFTVSQDALPAQIFWTLYTVKATDPKHDTLKPKGSTVAITEFKLGGQ
jgi:serine/threonine-protein kinase